MGKTKSVLVSCKTSEHYTPASHIELARRVLGTIDLDPGSCTKANKVVQAKVIYTAKAKLGGWERPWFGNVWCNPPGDPSGKMIRRYWAKATEHARSGGVVIWAGFSISQMVGLGTHPDIPGPGEWTHVVVWDGPSTTGGGRIKWIDGATMTEGKAPQHGNFYCLLGGDRATRDRFRKEFAVFGKVSTPSRLPAKPRTLREQTLGILRAKSVLGVTKTQLGQLLKCRHDTACKLVDRLVDELLIERRSRAYFAVNVVTRS